MEVMLSEIVQSIKIHYFRALWVRLSKISNEKRWAAQYK